MDHKIFYKKLFILVLPIAVQNLMSALVSASDALMLGWLDQESLSAVSLATQVQFVQNLFLSAITIGLTLLAAQYWGKKDQEAVENVLAIALRYSIGISVLFGIAAFCFPELLMKIFTNENQLIHLGAGYLRIVSASYIFTGISQLYLCVMKNSGRVTRSTIYGTVAIVLNLFLNALLIFGLAGFERHGIKGAAIATTIARAMELGLVLWENRNREVVRIRLKYLRRPADYLCKDFWKYTAPVFANEIVWGCGFTMFSVIMGHLGSDAVAANSIANIVKNIIACVSFGISAGSGIIIGNELGKGKLELARKYGDKLCHISIVIGIISGALILLSSPLVLTVAGTLSVQAKEYLKEMMYICSYYMIGKSASSVTIGGIFCAGGDTRFGLICDAINMWLVIVPMGILSAFVFKWPVMVVYFLLNLDEITKLPAIYIHYKKYNWVKNITQ